MLSLFRSPARLSNARSSDARSFRRSPALWAVPLLPALALLAGCATPEAQLRTGLVNAGLSQPMARCMATPMARDLSINQLMKLRSLGNAGKMDPAKTSYAEFMHRVRALRDAEIIRVTAAAALGCALG